MPFVRRKRGQVLVVHNRRLATGGSEQVVLQAFASPAELSRVLQGAAWTAWREDMGWRHPDYTWKWAQLRQRLVAQLRDWEAEETPSGGLRRRAEVVSRLAEHLVTNLRGVTLASPADRALIELARRPLAGLKTELERLLGATPGLARPGALDEEDMDELGDEADQVFEDGMERWWAGDRRGACRLYRRALTHDPQHADAHNHLGIDLYERGRLEEAERHFRAAIEGGRRRVRREGALIAWGRLENRPYLRGLANLALALSRRGRWGEVVELWEQLLRLNPDDNQGVRFLLGGGYHRLGRLADAIRACEAGLDDPGTCFDLALALHERGEPHRVGMPLLLGFAGNRYLAPLLLGERWRRLQGFHGTSQAEPEWARDYVDRQGDLWRRVAGSADMLRRWWSAEPVRAWRARLDDLIVRLGHLPVGAERSAAVRLGVHLADADTRAALARAVDPQAVVGPATRTRRRRLARERSPS